MKALLPLFPALALVLMPAFSTAAPAPAAPADDPYRWLEEVNGTRAMAWVQEQNKVSTAELTTLPEFEALRSRFLTILNSDARIPAVTKYGDLYYNFWRDAKHVRGIWRRTTLAEYRKAEPAWETALDLDALAAAEKENWIWEGVDVLEPACTRCLLRLSAAAPARTSVVSSISPRKPS
jgi:prolyl oligopeptidase